MSVEDFFLIIQVIFTALIISSLHYSKALSTNEEDSSSVTPAFRPGILSHPHFIDRAALHLFHLQAAGNPVYREYLELLGCDPAGVTSVDRIPFLPVNFFKSHRVVTGPGREVRVFESSGTTGAQTSKHYLLSESDYTESYLSGFRQFFGEPSDWCILSLLPSYLERQNSSLVFMMDHLIRLSRHPLSGFYLNNLDELANNLSDLEKSGQKTMLLGVTYALLDLAEQFPMPLKKTLIVETGGMKGRREEITREELHDILKRAFGVGSVGSEYGMTELLSQAWSKENGIFHTPPQMQILIRDPYNPFRRLPAGKTGGIDIIDLANRHSCAFIQTQDLGQLNPDGTFEVLGRFDNSEIRGCNLLA